MSLRSGDLLWNRMHVALDEFVEPPGRTTQDIDTGLRQNLRGFPGTEPTLGTSGVAAPADGVLPVSRLMVIPLPPLAAWASVEVAGEPYFHTGTQTMHVALSFNEGSVEVNVLFKIPSTLEGPGEADTYNAP